MENCQAQVGKNMIVHLFKDKNRKSKICKIFIQVNKLVKIPSLKGR